MLRPPDELHQRVGEDASDELPCSGDSHAFELVPDRTLREPWNASLPLLRLLCTVTTSIAHSGPAAQEEWAKVQCHICLTPHSVSCTDWWTCLCTSAMTRCVSSPNCSQAHWLSLAGRALTQTDPREDVFKRHISGDTAACLLPHAVLTKMVTLTG